MGACSVTTAVVAPAVPLRVTSESVKPETGTLKTTVKEMVRVVLGPQEGLFLDESIQTFLTFDWKFSNTSDRMGCRFIGPKLEFKPRPDYLIAQAGSDPSNIVDDTIPVGGIQVPSGLEPIVLHVDGPSLGGYAKIATVISADLGKVGQMRPGDIANFQGVSTTEAVAALRDLEAAISESSISME